MAENDCKNCPHRDSLCANGYCFIAQSQTEPEKAAKRLARTGSRRDLQRLNRARRNNR